MFDKVRAATPEECAALADNSDLTPSTSVWAFEKREGKPDFIVARIALELDPLHFAEDSPTNRRALFVWETENHYRKLGFNEYYFNIDATDEKWLSTVLKWGAQIVSQAPEYRLKKVL